MTWGWCISIVVFMDNDGNTSQDQAFVERLKKISVGMQASSEKDVFSGELLELLVVSSCDLLDVLPMYVLGVDTSLNVICANYLSRKIFGSQKTVNPDHPKPLSYFVDFLTPSLSEIEAILACLKPFYFKRFGAMVRMNEKSQGLSLFHHMILCRIPLANCEYLILLTPSQEDDPLEANT